MGGSTKTTKTELPDPTPEELQNIALQNAMIEQLLESEGFDMERVATPTFDNPAKIDALQESSVDLEAQINSLQDELARAGGGAQAGDVQTRLQQAKGELGRVKRDLADEMEKATTQQEVKLTKREDPRVLDLRGQGKSAEADALKEQLRQTELEDLTKEDEINALFLDAAKKYLSGDTSITERQEAELNASTDRIRQPVLDAIQDIESQIGITEQTSLDALLDQGLSIGETFKGVSEALSGVEQKIQETGLSVEEALMESSALVKQNGISMNEALDESIAKSRELGSQNLFKQTRELRLKNATLAANLGRSDLDPAFVKELQDDVTDATTNLELNLAVQQAQGKLAVNERTAAALEGVQSLRVGQTQRTGQAFEDVAQRKAALEETTGLRREQLLGNRADILQAAGLRREDLGRTRASLAETLNSRQEQQRLALGQGLPLSQIQTGSSFQAGQSALGQQGFQNLGQINQQTGQQVSQAQAIRAAQPTTTTKTSGNVFGSILSGIGVGGSAAGSIFSGLR